MSILMSTIPELFQLDTDTQTKLSNLDTLTDLSYDEFATEYDKIVRVSDSDRESESDFAVGGFGLPQAAQGELGGVNYDQQGNWYPQTYVFSPYNLGFVISKQMQMNDKWGLAAKRGQWLARSFRRLPEVLVARMFNESFSATTKSGIMNAGRRSPDGRPLFDTAHPNPGPGASVQANRKASGGADLSHASVETMMINMASVTDDRGMPIQLDMATLLTPKALYPRACEITDSSFRTDTLNRVKNVLSTVMPYKPVQNHYLTNPAAYFGLADASQTGLRWIWRERPNRNMWINPDNRAIHYSIWCQFDFGWSHWFGAYGDPGAGG